jgi:hypothetical protein
MKLISCSLFVLLCAMSLQSFAARDAGGYGHDNGGDICENRFKSVRDELSVWIVNGGSKDLRLPPGISHKQYDHDMLEVIRTAKVSCIDTQILIGGAEKTCKNFVDADGSLRIQCNTNRFLTTSSSNQYVLVHHEYAGLAGFEVNSGEESHYQISNQIINGLIGLRIAAVKSTLEFIATVAALPDQGLQDHSRINNSICMFIGRISAGDMTVDLFRELAPLNITEANKLRLNIKSLMNYCSEGITKEDPNPISFEDVPGLLARIKEIQQQLLDIETFLAKRFAYSGN